MQKKQNYSSPYELEGKIPLGQAILYGLQHVMAMFVGNLTPVLLITGACALSGELQLQIIQNAMLITGLLLFQKNALFTGFSAIYRTKKLKKGDKKGVVLVMYSSVTICY